MKDKFFYNYVFLFCSVIFLLYGLKLSYQQILLLSNATETIAIVNEKTIEEKYDGSINKKYYVVHYIFKNDVNQSFFGQFTKNKKTV